jgi:ketosteroid isomerase-like protein
MTTVPVVDAYFAAIRAKDADALGALFTDDAALVTLAGTFTGPEAIAGFYRDLAFQTEDLWPEPGRLVVDGQHVAVEIRLRLNGKVSLVGDFFTLRNGRIERLLICNGPPA